MLQRLSNSLETRVDWLFRIGVGFVAVFFLVYYSDIRGSEYIALASILISLSGRFRLHVFGALNLIFLVFFNFTFWTRTDVQLIFTNDTDSLWPLWISKGLGVVLLLGTFNLLWQIQRRLRGRYLFLINFVLLLFLAELFRLLPPTNNLAYLGFRAYIIFYSHFFWVLTFSLLTFSSRNAVPLTDWLCSLPFWISIARWHIGAIPRGIGELRSCLASTPEEIQRCRRSALKLMILAYLFRYICDQLYIYYLSSSLPQYFIWGIHASLAKDSTVLQLWLTNLLCSTFYIFYHASYLCLLIGVARFCGFFLPPGIYDVFRSRSFGDLVRHVYFYYSETISYFFLPTIWRLVNKIPTSRSIRNGLTSFLSLFIGGICIHLIGFTQYDLDPSRSFWRMTMLFSPFLFALGLCAGVSAAWPSKSARTGLRIIPVLFYFVFFDAVRIFLAWFWDAHQYIPTETTLNDYLTFLLRHFGF